MAEQKRAKRPRTPAKATDAQILAAIDACGGIYKHIGAMLGMSRQAVAKRVESSEQLQAACKDAREEIVDIAESALFKATKRGAQWAVRLVLTKLGKERGYTSSITVDAKVDQVGKVVIQLPDNGRDIGRGDNGTSEGN